MKNKSVSLYVFLISVIFIVAVLFFGVSILREYRGGQSRTDATFDTLSSTMKTAVVSYKTDSPEFRSMFEQALGSYDNYDSLVLSKNNVPIFSYPDMAITESSSKLNKIYSVSIPSGNDTYNISAVMYLLRPTSVFYYARFSFVLVFIATLLTIILLAYLYLFKNQSEKTNAEKYDFDADEYFSDDDLDCFNADADKNYDDDQKKNNNVENVTATNIETEVETEAIEVSSFDSEMESVSENSGNEYVQQHNDNEAHVDTQTQDDAHYDHHAEITHLESNDADISDDDFIEDGIGVPQGLFSPVTGFGWEEYLEPRLDSELIRATASESDLALFLIKIPGLAFTDALTKKVCEYLHQQFQYNDLLFEYMNDGYAVIRENTTIEEALNLAESIHKDIEELISSTGYTCHIGLATRSVRILPGKRLITEAVEALKRAVSEKESPIFAFKANDDKYREYIESRS